MEAAAPLGQPAEFERAAIDYARRLLRRVVCRVGQGVLAVELGLDVRDGVSAADQAFDGEHDLYVRLPQLQLVTAADLKPHRPRQRCL
jgi:hypothetical protein